MARPTNDQARATRSLAITPNFGVWGGYGGGLGFDHYLSLLPELQGADLLRDMFLMAETDETVGAMLYCINTVMRQMAFTYVPQIDGVDAEEDPEAKKFAALAEGMLIDMNQSMGDHVEDAMTMLWAGFAPIEIVMKRRNGLGSRFSDGYYGIRALNLIDQTTIYDWHYNGDEMVAMQQMFGQNGHNGVVPLDKVLLYRTTTQYNRPQGRPLLKNAWRVWRLKRKIQDSEALGIERELCGLPIFEMPMEYILRQFETEADGSTLTDDAKQARAMVAAAKTATQDMRLNKSGGLVIPSDTWADENQADTSRRFNFRIQTTGGQRSIDSRTAARDYDHAIARVAMMQFLTLGQRSGGSYGLSEDQSSMAISSISAIADKIVTEWNAKATPMVWRVNALPEKYRPRLKASEVNKNGVAILGQFLAGVGKAADLWGGDAEMRVALAKAGNLPYDYDAQVEAAELHTKAAEQAGKPKPAPSGGGSPSSED